MQTIKMNRALALENLVLARDCLASRGVPMFLHFGTVLGAVREKDFIAHDDDADAGIYGRDKEAFLASFPALAELGFENLYCRNDRQYKFRRLGEELDFFVAVEGRKFFRRVWDLEGKATIPARHLDTLDDIEFLGESFKVPHDPIGFVRNLYGRTWRVPIADSTSRHDWTVRLGKLFKKPTKLVYYALRYAKERIRWIRTAAKKG